MNTRYRLGVLAGALLFGLAVSAAPAVAAGEPDGTRGPQTPPGGGDQKGDKKTNKKKQNQGQNQQDLRTAYQHARALIIDGQYEAGIAAMRALGHDDHPEVANYIGYASRKLGRYEDAKIWYERALATDPNHTRTWQYYGMWHLEQGNMLKAQDHLEKIRLICGNTECSDYVKLKEALEGNISY